MRYKKNIAKYIAFVVNASLALAQMVNYYASVRFRPLHHQLSLSHLQDKLRRLKGGHFSALRVILEAAGPDHLNVGSPSETPPLESLSRSCSITLYWLASWFSTDTSQRTSQHLTHASQ